MLPVDAAAAPNNIGGMANISRAAAAIQLVSLAVAGENDDNVLW